MEIYFDDGRCGDGKTFAQLTKMAQTKGKYILAMDKIDLMSERKTELRALCSLAGTVPVIEAINSDVSVDVAAEVEAIAENAYSHQIVMITHTAMKNARFGSAFADWQLVIDEDFSVLTSKDWTLTVAADLVNTEFDFVETDKPDVFKLVPSTDLDQLAHSDVLASELKELREMAGRHAVYTDQPSAKAERLRWWSVWDFKRLEAFASITILANAFTEKLSFKLASLNGIEFERLARIGQRQWISRPVIIRYFSERSGSKTYFDSSEAITDLAKIRAWQAKHFSGQEFWSANTTVAAKLKLQGQQIKPISAGRNDLQNHSVCTFIYSARSSPVEDHTLKNITNGKLAGSLIIRDREQEAIGQFILRGSLRQPDDQRPVEIRLFSRDQAEFARDFLARNGYVNETDIMLDHVDLGLKITERKSTGRPKLVLTEAELEARAEAKREKERLKKQRQRAAKKAA